MENDWSRITPIRTKPMRLRVAKFFEVMTLSIRYRVRKGIGSWRATPKSIRRKAANPFFQ